MRALTERQRAQIVRLHELWEPDDIAEFLDLAVADVEEALGARRRPQINIVLRDAKTGRIWRVRSWRAAYRNVCLHGLTEWGWWPAEVWDEHQRALKDAA